MSKAAYLSPSLACCPLERLAAHVRELEQLGADLLHVDIMDGDFVANYCLGTEFVPLLHRITRLPLDIHLMVQRPEQKIAYFALAPRDFVTVHAESTPHVHKALAAIRAQGARAGLALNPATPLEACRWVLDDLDLLLIMTINQMCIRDRLFLCARMQAGNALFAEQKKGRRFYSGALSAKKGVSDTNQPGKRFQQPSIEQAHGDAVRVGHGVGGQRGQALYHNLAKERRYQGRQQRNKQAVHDAGNDGAAAAARSIGENGGSAAGKEI